MLKRQPIPTLRDNLSQALDYIFVFIYWKIKTNVVIEIRPPRFLSKLRITKSSVKDVSTG